MKNLSANEFLTLSPGQLVSVMVEAGLRIRVDCGLVWITIEGDKDDYWLRDGDTLVLIPGRHIVIEADKDFSRIDVLPLTASEPRMFRATDKRAVPGKSDTAVTAAAC